MAAPPIVSPAEAAKGIETGSIRTPQEFEFALLILALAFASFLILYLISRKEAHNDFALRIFVITIIVFGSLLVLSFSYSTEQIAPVVGLFGTIAGYVLGRTDTSKKESENATTESDHA